jgi:hypothetical protein
LNSRPAKPDASPRRSTRDAALVLGLIVLLRTGSGFELTLEIEGRWLWQRGAGADDAEV